jgi:hypothetical protein
MTRENFKKIENDLRSAVIHRRYADVGRLAQLFCAAATASAKPLPPGDPARAEIARHVEEVLEWGRLMLSVARAMNADELRRLPFLRRFGGSVEPPRGALRLDG